MSSGTEIEPRLRRLEDSHGILSSELGQINKTLTKIEIAIEKQNEIHMDVRLLSQKFESHVLLHHEDFKIIEKLEDEIKQGIRPITLKNLLVYAVVLLISFGTYLEMKTNKTNDTVIANMEKIINIKEAYKWNTLKNRTSCVGVGVD